MEPPDATEPAEGPPAKPKLSLRERARGLAKKLALVAISVGLALSVGELTLRLRGKHFESSLHTPDPELGWAFRPGARGWSTLEGRDYITINSDGQRDREHAIAKPEGTLRIAVVGDSFAAAYNLPMEQAFWSVLERDLGACPALGGRKVEVLNFGVGGYGTAQELLMLRKKVWKYQPDIVLLAFFGGNDLLDNLRELTPTQPNEPPYFTLRGDELVLDDRFARHVPGPTMLQIRNLVADGMNHVELLLLLKQATNARARALPKNAKTRPRDLSSPARLVFEPPTDPRFVESWRVTEVLLRQFHKEVKAGGAELRMMAVSSAQQVHPDLAEREAFLKVLQVETLFYVEERLAKLAAQEGFPFSSLPQPMAEHAARNNVFLHGYPNAIPWGGHWSPAGHTLAGELVAADFCKQLAAPAPSPAP